LGGGVKQQTLELQVSKMMAVMLQGVPGGRWDLQLRSNCSLDAKNYTSSSFFIKHKPTSSRAIMSRGATSSGPCCFWQTSQDKSMYKSVYKHA